MSDPVTQPDGTPQRRQNVTTTKRVRLQRNEHGGPQLPLDSGDFPGGIDSVISAVPQQGGDLLAGYIWLGNSRGCFGTIETRALLAFADEIRKRV